MASPNQAEELSRTIQARIDANNQESHPRSGRETSGPSVAGSAFDVREDEGHGGSQTKHQKVEQTGTNQPGSPIDIEKTGPLVMPQEAVGVISAQKLDNSGPTARHGNPISHQFPSKGTQDPISAIETLPELSKEQLVTLQHILSLIEVTSTSKVEFIWSSVLQLAGLLFVVIFGVFAALAYDAANVSNKQSSQANQLSLLNLCMNQGTPGDTCIAVSQNSLDSLSSLATAILGPGATLTTVTLSPSSVPTSSLFSSSESSSTTNSTPVATGSSNSASTSSSTIPPVSTLAPTTTSSTSAVQTSSIGSIPSPTPTPTPSPLGSSSNSHHHLSTPALVGTIVGVILGLASISVSCCAFYTRFPRSGRGKRSTSSEGDLRGGYLGLWRRAELRTPLTV